MTLTKTNTQAKYQNGISYHLLLCFLAENVCMYVCKTLFQHAIFVNYLHQLVSTKGVLCTLNLRYVTKHTLIKLLITKINLTKPFP